MNIGQFLALVSGFVAKLVSAVPRWRRGKGHSSPRQSKAATPNVSASHPLPPDDENAIGILFHDEGGLLVIGRNTLPVLEIATGLAASGFTSVVEAGRISCSGTFAESCQKHGHGIAYVRLVNEGPGKKVVIVVGPNFDMVTYLAYALADPETVKVLGVKGTVDWAGKGTYRPPQSTVG